MAALVQFLAQFLRAGFIWIVQQVVKYILPLIRVIANRFVVTIVGTAAAIILDPAGFVSTAICWFIDLLVAPIPDMPQQYTIAGIAQTLGTNIPFIGSGIFYKITRDVAIVVSLGIPIKVYKLMPFKFS